MRHWFILLEKQDWWTCQFILFDSSTHMHRAIFFLSSFSGLSLDCHAFLLHLSQDLLGPYGCYAY
jgi:hypothetical protein